MDDHLARPERCETSGPLPRIRPWADVVASFIRPGGFLYVTEAHPILWAHEDDFALKYRYWEREEPKSFDIHGSYADPTAEVKTEKDFEWNPSLGEIVTALARAGLRIEFLHEWPFLAWDVPFLEERDGLGCRALSTGRCPDVLAEGDEARLIRGGRTGPGSRAGPGGAGVTRRGARRGPRDGRT